MRFSSYNFILYELIQNDNQHEYQELKTNIERILKNLLETLKELLKLNINHNNINPSNIVVSISPLELKLFNFIIPQSYNIYAEIEDNQVVYRNDNFLNKSENYAPPEVSLALSSNKNCPSYSPEKNDIYSLGACILKIFLGNEPLLLRGNDAINAEIVNSTPMNNRLKELIIAMLSSNQENRPRYDECIEHLNGMSLRKITKLPNIQPCEIKSLK